jgi:hypothetical protein
MAQRRSILSILLRLALLPVLALVLIPAAPGASIAYAQSGTITLRVQSARAWAPSNLALHQAIPTYKWVIVKDDTGDTTHYAGSAVDCAPQSIGGDADYPANCQWPSIKSSPGGTAGEIVVQGDQDDLNQTTGITLPDGKYMISAMADGFDTDSTHHVNGFKIDGQWFTVNGGSQLVTVDAQPYPLPLLTVRMQVFEDINANGEYDTGEAGLPGFEGHISDVLDEVTTDWYGNPLCTEYQHDINGNIIFDADDRPVILRTGGKCLSDANGVVSIPYLGPNRYSAEVVAPDGQQWVQMTSLEGGLDWDIWAQEGWNGYDPEFVNAPEPFPFAIFGFVRPTSMSGHPDTPIDGDLSANGGTIKGTAIGIRPFTPTASGVPFGVEAGNGIAGPIDRPEVALVSLAANDTIVWQGRGNADGTFQINNVRAGTYLVAIVDQPENYLVEATETIVTAGQVDDMGILDQFPWFGNMYGKVCNDLNRNGKCESDEPGIPGLSVDLLSRDNSLQDQGQASAITDSQGNYKFTQVYPLGQWVVSQVYDERYYTTGVTYQTNSEATETTVMANGGFVDVSTFNQVGHITRFDWALHRYETPADAALGPTNGGIVGTVWYGATRNELDARFAANEDYEAGIPGLDLHLYAPVPCDPAAGNPLCAATTTPAGTAYYLLNTDGSYAKLSDGSGNPIELNAPYTSETWSRPVDCTARDVNFNRVVEQVLPPPTGGHECLEAFLMANQVSNNSTGVGMTVNGNFGFVDGCLPATGGFNPSTGLCADGSDLTELAPADYLVEVTPPDDSLGHALFKPVREEDINVFTGDEFVAPGETPVSPPTPVQPNASNPQPTPQVPPFLCAGALHTVDVADSGTDNYPAVTLPNGVVVPPSTPTVNPGFVDAGGSPFEGQQQPLCSTRLITVQRGKSSTPNFHYFTDVPLPGRIHGLITDDLNTSTNPRELFYGEKAGIPNIPIGIYDFSNRLVTTIHTDPNGVYEVILPSTSSYNCPLPAGPCPGVYRLLANDPGQPGHLNPDYNPQYRTLAVFQQVWPNLTLPSDLAPIPASYFVESPGSQTAHPPQCLLNDPAQPTAPAVPELYAVSKPLVLSTDTGTARNITISGQYFGSSAGQVLLDNIALPLTGPGWNSNGRQITVNVPTTIPPGPHQLKIVGSNGQSTINGLTFHVLGTGYTPTVLSVGPGRTYDPTAANRNTGGYEHALQDALNDAAATTGNKLVVVYPGPQGLFNPFGAYFENIVIPSPVKLQGVGPGGVYPDGTHVLGSVLDGTGFGTDNAKTTAWQTLVGGLTFLQPPTPPEFMPYGEVVLVLSQSNRPFTASYKAAIDGLTIQGGDVANAPPNLNDNGGGSELSLFEPLDPFFQAGVSQGGGIFAYAATPNLQITNNILTNNGGAYGGAIRLGTPYAGDNALDGIRIGNNQIVANGGSNLAGSVGIFAGADNYEVDHNNICGNFSAEYGGGVSHFGLSLFGKIHDNRIYFNGSYDEGAGVIVAGELPLPQDRQSDPTSPLPAPPAGMSPGSGPVDVYNNVIQSNLAGDDGGGLRYLMAGNFVFNAYNNMIVNNISTHEGGGVALDDAPNVRFYNNTVLKNITTATAVSSNGLPAAAGLSTMQNSNLLQGTLPPGSPLYSDPLQFNNIYCDNRAGRWDGANIIGIGYVNVAGQTDPNPINYWDLGADGPFLLHPTNSILQPQPTTNPGLDPTLRPPAGANKACPSSLTSLIKTEYNTSMLAFPWRGDNHFVGNVIIAQDVPPSIMGDYHLASASTLANNAGASGKSGIFAPASDIDGDYRPSGGGFEIGADETAGPFPVIDTFNRANASTLGSNWIVGTAGSYGVLSNQARVINSGYAYWSAGTGFGANQEAFLTFTKVVPTASDQDLILKAFGLIGSSGLGSTTRFIRVQYDATTSSVIVQTYCGSGAAGCGSQALQTRATFNNVTFANGDRFSARSYSDGTVNVYKNGALIGSVNVTTGPNPWPAAFASASGRIGVWFIRAGGFASPNDAQFDDFGGNTLP